MNREIRNLWIAALRSGDYQQGTGNLQHIYSADEGYKYCCLGVLCDIAKLHGVDVPTNEEGWYTSNDPDFLLDKNVRVWAGLNDDDGNYNPIYGGSGALYRDNDNRTSFNQIADIIEREF